MNSNNNKFNSIWTETQVIVDKYDLKGAKLPRERKIPVKLGGGKGKSQQNSLNVENHYLINVYFVVLDIIIADIDERFKENNLTLLNVMNDILTGALPDVASCQLVCNTYNINISELQSEVNIFNRMFKAQNMKENVLNFRISYLLSNNIQIGFPLYVQILKLFLTLPTNTVTCERSFSTLKRIKTYLRCTTGQDRLNNLAILYVHRNHEVNKDDVIKEFDATENGRRMILH